MTQSRTLHPDNLKVHIPEQKSAEIATAERKDTVVGIKLVQTVILSR